MVLPLISQHWADARPKRPLQGAYSESLNGKLRDALLLLRRGEQVVFATLAEAKVLAERRRRHYIESRPSARLSGAKRARLPFTGRLCGYSVSMNRRRRYHTGWYEERGPVMVVQRASALGAARVPSACRLLPPPGDSGHRGGTHVTQPPANPGRFSVKLYLTFSYWAYRLACRGCLPLSALATIVRC